jgi:hypothetical protein
MDVMAVLGTIDGPGDRVSQAAGQPASIEAKLRRRGPFAVVLDTNSLIEALKAPAGVAA